jgi:hypothetical protein
MGDAELYPFEDPKKSFHLMQLKGAKVFEFDTLAREKSLSIGHISKGKSFFFVKKCLPA